MPYSVLFNTELGIVEAVFSGIVTAEEVRAETAECLVLSRENKTSMFLTDLREADLRLTTVDIVTLPDLYSSIGSRRPVRMAVMPPPHEKGRKDVAFYETVCINQGWTAKVFSERREAIDWLLVR